MASSRNRKQRIKHQEQEEQDHDHQLHVSHEQASSIRKGDVILIRGQHPCKIVQLSTSKTGKHGVAKVQKYIYLLK